MLDSALSRTFLGKLTKTNSNLSWDYRVVVPKDIVKDFHAEQIQRIICRFDDKMDIHSALLSSGDGRHFIMINKDVRKQLSWDLDEVKNVTITPDTSTYGIYTAPEFLEVLEQFELGSTFFHQLTPGKQRSLIHMASSPKTSATRIKKSIVILEYLENSKGALDFKELMQAFKNANQNRF